MLLDFRQPYNVNFCCIGMYLCWSSSHNMYTHHILMQILEINIFMQKILSFFFQNLFKAIFDYAICGRGLRLTTRLHPMLTLRMSGTIPPLPHTFMLWIGTSLTEKFLSFEITMPSACVCVTVFNFWTTGFCEIYCNVPAFLANHFHVPGVWIKKGFMCLFNPLNTKRRLLYLKIQSVPRCKHSSSRL